jgi:hypothetical protein
VKPDPFAVALKEFFERFNYGKMTLPEDDIRLIAAWLFEIPPHAAFLHDEFAAGFARALDLLRREKTLRWKN